MEESNRPSVSLCSPPCRGSFPNMSRSPHRPSVLLVEDSDDDAFFFDRALRRCQVDCEFTRLENGALALDYLKNALASADGFRRPDVVFLDLKLPAFSGFDILRWIAEQNVRPPLKVVVLSGSEHQGDMDLARALGASDYCVKPISPERLGAEFAPHADASAGPARDSRFTAPREDGA